MLISNIPSFSKDESVFKNCPDAEKEFEKCWHNQKYTAIQLDDVDVNHTLSFYNKNFLFAGSHQGAEHAAVIYSLIESCKMLKINTFDYLKDVLQRLPTTLNKDISSLFPCYWKPLDNFKA